MATLGVDEVIQRIHRASTVDFSEEVIFIKFGKTKMDLSILSPETKRKLVILTPALLAALKAKNRNTFPEAGDLLNDRSPAFSVAARKLLTPLLEALDVLNYMDMCALGRAAQDFFYTFWEDPWNPDEKYGITDKELSEYLRLLFICYWSYTDRGVTDPNLVGKARREADSLLKQGVLPPGH